MTAPLSQELKRWLSPLPEGGERTAIQLKRPESGGPIAGILASRKSESTLAGNSRLFKDIQREMLSRGGISVVFAPEDVSGAGVDGIVYLPGQDAWSLVAAPLPDIIYNRVPFRKSEQTGGFRKAAEFFRTRKIPFFNPCFLEKFECYTVLKQDSGLAHYLPDTILIDSGPELGAFLMKHKDLYVKPNSSSKGKGILRVWMKHEGIILVKDLNGQTRHSDFAHFWNSWKSVFKEQAHIAQEAVYAATPDGHRNDFRILAHGQAGNYKVTGIGIRQAAEDLITTHIPNGGRLIPYEHYRTAAHDEFIQEAVQKAGDALSRETGWFGEFSMDAGYAENGRYVIYEINSKPMKFDEENIEAARIRRLADILFEKADY
jgi:YheC/D like ATP-grasp